MDNNKFPLLALWKGESKEISNHRKSFQGRLHYPSKKAQIQKFEPCLSKLKDAFDKQKISLTGNNENIDPECVLVFEVATGIDDFKQAIKSSKLEWMCEYDTDFNSDNSFYYSEPQNFPTPSKISGKLYMTIANKAAILQLLSLWEKYKLNRDFPKGLAKFKNLFSRLKDIRKWNSHDRFESTGVKDYIRDQLSQHPSSIKIEVELWYRHSSLKRAQARKSIEDSLYQYEGTIVKECTYSEIGYHGLIVEYPAFKMQEMIDDRDNDLINNDNIMWIRSSGQVVRLDKSEVFQIQIEQEIDSFSEAKPVIALFDGYPMANHKLLRKKLEIADPDQYGNQYLAKNMIHGTAMASLIIYGDLNHQIGQLNSPLYVRPILKPIIDPHTGDAKSESVPNDELIVDLLHRAVKEIKDDPKYNSIRVINLSIGNKDRPFNFEISPEARMIDYLSEKYNLLFFVSAGNTNSYSKLNILTSKFVNLSIDEQSKLLQQNKWLNQKGGRILSPAESINAITVGALNDDNCQYSNPTYGYINLKKGYPALYSALGGGFNNSIKPDCVNIGGREAYIIRNWGSSELNLSPALPNTKGPGVLTAAPENTTNVRYSCGTSDATALSSRICANLLPILHRVPNLSLPPEYESVALKTMYIHCCSWDKLGNYIKEEVIDSNANNKRYQVSRWIGYGVPNPGFVNYCTDQRVTLIGYGEIFQNHEIEFSFPLPQSLIAKAIQKTLTITLGWMSKISVKNKSYQLAKLSFKPKDDILKSLMPNNIRADVDYNSSRRGTVQHEIFRDSKASTYLSDDKFVVTVSCKKEKALTKPTKFVLMATIEIPASSNINIYQEVKSAIVQRNMVQVK